MSEGYLLDFDDFIRALSGAHKNPKEYQEIKEFLLTKGWIPSVNQDGELVIAINGKSPIPAASAYSDFKNDAEFYEAIYHRAMSIWR